MRAVDHTANNRAQAITVRQQARRATDKAAAEAHAARVKTAAEGNPDHTKAGRRRGGYIG